MIKYNETVPAQPDGHADAQEDGGNFNEFAPNLLAAPCSRHGGLGGRRGTAQRTRAGRSAASRR